MTHENERICSFSRVVALFVTTTISLHPWKWVYSLEYTHSQGWLFLAALPPPTTITSLSKMSVRTCFQGQLHTTITSMSVRACFQRRSNCLHHLHPRIWAYMLIFEGGCSLPLLFATSTPKTHSFSRVYFFNIILIIIIYLCILPAKPGPLL
jgi:hypothetical protein